jgi:adenylosuccinate synthase
VATKTAAPVKNERDAEKELEDALSGFEDEPTEEDVPDDDTDEDEDEDIPTRGRISAKNGGVDSLLRRTERRMRKAMRVAVEKFEAGVSERRDKLVAKHEAMIADALDAITLKHSGQVKDVARVRDTLARQIADAQAMIAKAQEQMAKLAEQSQENEEEDAA